MDVLGIILVGIGVLGLVAVGVWAYMTKGDGSMWMRIVAGVAALASAIVGIVLLGRKKKPEVITVEGHKRTVAPTEEETTRADVRAENLGERSEDLKSKDKELEDDVEDLDREKKELEARADETDKRLEELDGNSGDAAGDPGDRKPDPDISDRLRDS